MRRATSEIDWLTNEETGELVGISLGCDFCAEHEWGVEDLRRLLGVPMNTLTGVTLDKYLELSDEQVKNLVLDISSIKTIPFKDSKVEERGQVVYMEYMLKSKKSKSKIPAAYFGITDRSSRTLTPDNYDANFYNIPGDKLFNEKNNMISTSWSKEGFIIHVMGEDNISKLKTLYKSFVAGDIVFGSGLSEYNSRANRGLAFGMYSKLSLDTKNSVKEANENKIALYEKVKETGIVKRLKEAKRNWYALSPSVGKDGQLRFWLNPTEQSKYESCWATVEDLDNWILNTGPIVKGYVQPESSMNP